MRITLQSQMVTGVGTAPTLRVVMSHLRITMPPTCSYKMVGNGGFEPRPTRPKRAVQPDYTTFPN